ncbi:substrate-binding domain-containing protein [Ornithinimicrobium sp. Arc0846-15]|nr:substrate-binding domain-containing protein [Ornithinimicrobium laminariae]
MAHKRLFALAAASVLTVSACAPSSDSDSSAGSGDAESGGTVEVGVIYSETGPLAAYGEQYRAGLEAGLDYATDGTGDVDGTTIELVYRDDTGNPDTAVSAAKELIGDDVNIMVGTISSGIAGSLAEQAEQNEVLYISGPAAADTITGVNDYTFRSGRQSLQDVAAASAFLEGDNNTVVVFAQDNAFGQGNLAAVEAVLGAQGAEVTSVLVPEDATEFTPFAAQLIDSDPDLIFVAWAGATAGNMWQSLEQQNVFDEAPIVTGLADSATFGAYGPAADKISFLSHYFPASSDNDVNTEMVSLVEAEGATPDLFTPDGFVAGQMIAQAVAEGDGDVPAMIESLEGWEFEGPKGSYTIRASDHALIQDMFTARLVETDGEFAAELIDVVPADQVAPPEAGE